MVLEIRSKLEHFTLDELSKPVGAYSHGVIANGLLFTCGLGPMSPETGKISGDEIVGQTRQVFKNLELILSSKNVDFSRVVKLTAYLQNLGDDFKAYDSVCSEFLSTPYPARTTTGATLPGILIEIDCIVAL
jgi:2-iminobutanoate/2-iminopropanoate deaminase